MTASDLLRHNLGPASALLDDPAAADLDWDPPAAVLAALAERTGAGLGELRRMTIAGWVPWLLDTLDAAAARRRSTPTSAALGAAGPRRSREQRRPPVAALATDGRRTRRAASARRARPIRTAGRL